MRLILRREIKILLLTSVFLLASYMPFRFKTVFFCKNLLGKSSTPNLLYFFKFKPFVVNLKKACLNLIYIVLPAKHVAKRTKINQVVEN